MPRASDQVPDGGGLRAFLGTVVTLVRQVGPRAAVRTALSLLRDFGLAGLVRRLRSLSGQADRDKAYRRWVAAHDPTAADLTRLAAAVAALPDQPLITIVTPVHDTDPAWLHACVDSVRHQVYPRWQLVLCDDASTSKETLEALEALAGDTRIDVLHLPAARNIAGATNEAIEAARGDFVAFLDHDDELAPDALAEIVRAIKDRPDVDVVYSDEDKLDEGGRRTEPFFKPDWSPEYLLSTMYVGHLMVVRRELLREVGGLRDEYSGSQDHDVILRLAERTPRVHHVPRVLYHWRRAPGSAAATGAMKPWAADAAKRALSEHLQRRGIAGSVAPGPAYGQYRVRVRPPDALVSVVVIGHEAGAGARSDRAARLVAQSGAARVEWLVPRASPGRPDGEDSGVRVVHAVAGETWAAFVNRAARQATGTYMVCVSAALEPLAPDWLDILIGFVSLDGVGVAGARILTADDRVFHAGMVTGVEGGYARIFDGASAGAPGYIWNIHGVRNCAAVSAACLVTSRTVFDEVGGFDESLRSGADVDYCLKVRRQGQRVVYAPDAMMRWVGRPPGALADVDSASVERLTERWRQSLHRDPYYNENFARGRADFRLPDDID